LFCFHYRASYEHSEAVPSCTGNWHEDEMATHTGCVAKHPGQVYGGESGCQRAATLAEGNTKITFHRIEWSTHSPQMLREAHTLLSCFRMTLHRMICHKRTSAVSLGCMLAPSPRHLGKRGDTMARGGMYKVASLAAGLWMIVFMGLSF